MSITNFAGIDNWHRFENQFEGNSGLDVFPRNGTVAFGAENAIAPIGKDGVPATAMAGGPIVVGGLVITAEGVHFQFTKHNMKRLV